jgi:hypothetical protein
MASMTVKEDFHKLIEDIDDENYLKDIYDTMAFQFHQKKDVLDDLSTEQIKRIEQSIKQIDEGKGIPHEIIKAKHQRWLIK